MGPLLSTLSSAAFFVSSLVPTTGGMVVSSAAVIDTAHQYIGTPYCKGGSRGKCFDCSGFTSFVYGKNGVDISKGARHQYKQALIISREEAVPGDLVFFKTKSGYVYHVGIYLGNNTMIHSPRYGKRVKVEQIWSERVVFGRVATLSS